MEYAVFSALWWVTVFMSTLTLGRNAFGECVLLVDLGHHHTVEHSLFNTTPAILSNRLWFTLGVLFTCTFVLSLYRVEVTQC